MRAAIVESNHKLDNLFTIRKLKLEESVKEKEDENSKKKDREQEDVDSEKTDYEEIGWNLS